MYICVDAYSMHKLITTIFTIGIATIYNFTLIKYGHLINGNEETNK